MHHHLVQMEVTVLTWKMDISAFALLVIHASTVTCEVIHMCLIHAQITRHVKEGHKVMYVTAQLVLQEVIAR